MLRMWRKNSLKRVLSFSREYWVYFDITSKRSSEFGFLGEFGKSRDFLCEQIESCDRRHMSKMWVQLAELKNGQKTPETNFGEK